MTDAELAAVTTASAVRKGEATLLSLGHTLARAEADVKAAGIKLSKAQRARERLVARMATITERVAAARAANVVAHAELNSGEAKGGA